ncbi:FAD-dependent 2-octaprenylphenol hydroxylase [Alteromonas pelagimontana]|uniref:FAD-dependent 2-octaprenylphenol hydroxylase n=1 Tax=Alteromonas pelagimontana TaxID=1858656 RepID=A0A6M4M9Z1_9ALTE|nr:FAD-dependent monooxygenase [Alteromonas pelagimontana]QJR79984.1 FAD-dependent 2-octaprenylphenol hydroxylase [Alteromonas pelagimontana]
MHKVDIAIVGGGMVGLTLANALQALDIQVAVISDKPLSKSLPNDPLLRVSAINGANATALQRLHVWQRMEQSRLAPYTSMTVWDKDSFGEIHFNSADIGAAQLGHILENQVLINALAESVRGQNVTALQGQIAKVLWGQQETMLMLDTDEVVACRLVVGADGANSYIRRQANFPLTFRDYGQTAIVANIHCEQPHDQCARQVFTPHGPLALLPMADPHTCSIVWSQTHEQAKHLLALDDTAFSHALTATSNSVLGLMSLASARQHFPLVMRYSRQWASDGVVIIGDAAHTIHPLAGQGANLGMQDAFALATAIENCLKANKDFSRLRHLRPFERERKAQAIKMIAAMDGFKTLFAGDNPLKKLIRGAGLTATDHLPLLKQKWLNEAMGW